MDTKKKRLKWIRGATTEELLAYNFPIMDNQTKSRIATYKRLIVQKYMHLAKVMPGTIELLRFLKSKNLIVGMVTNNSHKELKHFLRYFRFKKYFDTVVGIDQGKPKPSTEMFKVFMKKTRLKPSEIIYVGDSNYDILACEKAEIKIIINTNIHKASQLKKADFAVKNLKKAKDVIGSLI